MAKSKNKMGLREGQCIVALPQRGNVGEDATSTEASWTLELPDGIDFDGQHFTLINDEDGNSESENGEGKQAVEISAEAKWLEPSLLSVEISVEKLNVSAPCARCLKQTRLAISDNLMYLYFLRGHDSDSKSDADGETGASFDDGFMPVEVDYFGRTLDLTPQVWESILLLLPSKVLCREDCAGLCPNCGADLNVGPCDCKLDNGDPRFEVLKNIVLDNDEQK